MSAAISSGNIGVNVRNDIQHRKEWQNILTEANKYFKKHPPFEIVYNPTLTQGKVDYVKELVDLSFLLEIRPTLGFKILKNLATGLEATKKQKEWGITNLLYSWADYQSARRGNEKTYISNFRIIVELQDDNGKVLSRAEKTIYGEWWFFYIYGSGGTEYDYSKIENRIEQDTILFNSVNANDITDNKIIKIISINGINIETIVQTGYINVSTENIQSTKTGIW